MAWRRILSLLRIYRSDKSEIIIFLPLPNTTSWSKSLRSWNKIYHRKVGFQRNYILWFEKSKLAKILLRKMSTFPLPKQAIVSLLNILPDLTLRTRGHLRRRFSNCSRIIFPGSRRKKTCTINERVGGSEERGGIRSHRKYRLKICWNHLVAEKCHEGLGEKRDDDKSLKCDIMELWQENDVTQNRRDRKGGKKWRNYAMENERGESLLGWSDITFQR